MIIIYIYKVYTPKLLFILLLISTFVQAQCNTDSMYNHVKYLSTIEIPRNAENWQELNIAASYIKKIFLLYNKNTKEQFFEVKNHIYKNIITSYGPTDAPVLVIGAHYDVYANTPGADANASGVAGILELARLLRGVENDLQYRIELVCYTLEEPPYFNTNNMGSYKHLKMLKEKKAKILGMINMDCIGYFSDTKKSQKHPFVYMKYRFGKKANYIAVVQKNTDNTWAKKITSLCKQYSYGVKVHSYNLPVPYKGMDYGDHKTYWDAGYEAVLITNTSFYRNKNYHQLTDTYLTLDYVRSSKVVDMVYKTILYYK